MDNEPHSPEHQGEDANALIGLYLGATLQKRKERQLIIFLKVISMNRSQESPGISTRRLRQGWK